MSSAHPSLRESTPSEQSIFSARHTAIASEASSPLAAHSGSAADLIEGAVLPTDSPESELGQLLRRCVLEIDEQWLARAERKQHDDGTTVTMVLIKDGHIMVANAGDSRTVACVNGQAVAQSVDHTGKRESERSRIEALGGEVSVTGRVRGKLMVTRAIGDRPYKQGLHEVIADPQIAELPLSPAVPFVLLACDGIWDVFSSADAIRFVRRRLATTSPKRIVQELIHSAFAAGSEDNLSAVLVVMGYSEGDATAHEELSAEGSDAASAKEDDDIPSQSSSDVELDPGAHLQGQVASATAAASPRLN